MLTSMEPPVYLDCQATTPLDPRVLTTMARWLGDRFGNAESPHHTFGWDARNALETARAQVAELIGARPTDVVFTSGGTEADNLAVRGLAEARYADGRHIVTSAVERRSILDTVALLEARKWEVTRVGVDAYGRVDPDEVRRAIRPDTVLVSIQLANHQVGTLQDVEAIGQHCAVRKTVFHCDATAAVPWIPIDVSALGIHLLSLSGHRMFGPMGIGALYLRHDDPRVRLTPLLLGGRTEGSVRAGTINMPGAVGLGRAAELCRQEAAADARRVAELRDRLEGGVTSRTSGVEVLAAGAHRLPNVCALTVAGILGKDLVLKAPEVAFAAGPECGVDPDEPSHVLTAMGLDDPQARSAVRFGLGRSTTEAEIDATIGRLIAVSSQLRHALRRPGG
jgi:cysteine desulfurase